MTIGCEFALASWRIGFLSRRMVLLLVATTLAAELASGLWIARLAPVMSFAFCLGAAMVLVGFIRPRSLLIGLAAAILVWPVLYTVRDATRNEVLGPAPQSSLDPSSRWSDAV